MKRRILALLLAACLVLQTIPAFVGAAEEQKVIAGTTSVMAGDTAYLSLWAENFANIATLEVYVYYDPSVFAVSDTYNGDMLYESQVSVNTAEAGTVKLVVMSLDGISGSGELLNLYFSTASGTAAGTYPVKVAIGNAYDTELKPVTVGSANGSITVREREETESFYVYNYTNNYYAQQGDTLYCYVNGEWSRGFVSGDFTLTYDHELFAYEDVVLSSELTTQGAIWSVNSSVLGQVRIAYACDKPINTYQLFTVKLKVIADSEEYASLKIQAADVYREDLSMYLPYSSETWVQLQKLPEVTDAPNVWLETSRMIVGQPATSMFWVEKGAGIAAADFTVTYDPAVLRCTGVTVCDTVAEKNGMVIVNDNFAEGKVRFSYINMDAYDAEDFSIVEIGWEPLCSPNSHYQLSVSGVGVVDADQKEIPLEYLTDSDCIFVRTVVPPQCLVDGYTNHACACGENYQTDTTEKLGHDIQNFPAQAVTCTEIGWDAYVGCSRCTYGSYVEIPALGHDEITHAGREVTCTEIGWEPYVTCSRCDHTTYEEIPALGHRVVVPTQVLADPFVVKNHDIYPFEFADGIYYSTNHNHNSMSQIVFTAEYDCVVTVYYGVSSESNCDIIRFRRNGSVLFNNSGANTGSIALSLQAGETIALDYQKDGSVDVGEDRGWIRLEYEYVWVDGYEDAPAETVEPDCVNPVVCTYCQTQIKAALGHDEIPQVGKAPTCLEPGWTEYVTCSRCDHTTYQELAALGHDTVFHEWKEPTCLEPGWEYYDTCSRCDYTTYQELPPYGHRVYMDRLSEVDPLTIQNDGDLPFEEMDGVYYSQNHTDNSSTEFTITALYDCAVTLIYSVSSETNCDKLHILHNGSQLDVISGTITNKRRNVELTAGDVLTVRYSKDVSVRNGEDRGWLRMEYAFVSQMMPTLVPAEEKDPTCTEPVVCDQCGTQVKETLPHEEIHHEGKAPACEEGGWAEYVTCAWCDYTTYQKLAPLGHDYYFNDPVPPTCTQDGVETSGGCTRCDMVIHVSTPALGHDITSHSAQAPTCTEVGWYSYESCSRCDYTTYQERPALGHDLVEHSAKDVTCTNIGWNAFDTCSRCDYTTYQEIPALGHSYGTWTQTKAPTCLNKGAQRRDCDRCDYFETRDVAAFGHDIIHHSGKDATCSEIGWDAYDTCSRCDYTTYVEIPATGHTPGSWITDREATYEADGSKHKECTVCKTVLETSIIPALTHTYVAVVTAPTCTEQGYTTHTCADCGNIYVEDYVPALGHGYGQWTQTLAPGCETPGEERRDCDRCDHYETRTAAPVGHTESDWIVAVEATCTETGTKQITCVTCGTVMETQTLPKLGHDEQIHAAQAPTCVTVGWEAYVTCGRCEYTTYTQISALDHQWLDRQETEERLCAQAADCTGYNTYWYGCSRCGAVSDSEYFVGTVKGPHSFTEQVKDDAHRVPGTDGQYYYDCAHCDTIGAEIFSDAIRGDVNQSGEVNVDDAIYLLQHVLMPNLFQVNQPADFNKSGEVDVDDAIYLLQHVLMPNLFPL